MVAGTLEVYTLAVKTFLPTPAKSHYTFNLRDFSRVIRGLLLVPSSRIQAPEKMFRLWVHESIRVFGDRLIEDSDRYLCVCVFFFFLDLDLLEHVVTSQHTAVIAELLGAVLIPQVIIIYKNLMM